MAQVLTSEARERCTSSYSSSSSAALFFQIHFSFSFITQGGTRTCTLTILSHTPVYKHTHTPRISHIIFSLSLSLIFCFERVLPLYYYFSWIELPALLVLVNRIRVVKPEKARQVEEIILRNAQMGRLGGHVDEDKLKQLLEQIRDKESENRTKITVQFLALSLYHKYLLAVLRRCFHLSLLFPSFHSFLLICLCVPSLSLNCFTHG